MASDPEEFKKGKDLSPLLLLLALFPLHFSGDFSSPEKRPLSEVCLFPSFQVQLLESASPVLYSAVWSLCACLQCAVHTVAFPEDQSPGEGNSCIQFYQEDPGGLGTRNLRTWTSSQDQPLITWVGTVTLVTT